MDRSETPPSAGDGEPARKRTRLTPRSGLSSRSRFSVAPKREADAGGSPSQRIDEAVPHVNDPATKISLPDALERYRLWMRAGAPHDDFCFGCKQPGDLDFCVTCRRSYHKACKLERATDASPEGGAIQGATGWFCEICVDRNWHINPPPLTPPASPELLPLAVPAIQTLPQARMTNSIREYSQNQICAGNHGVSPVPLLLTTSGGPGTTTTTATATKRQSEATNTTSRRGTTTRKSRYTTLSTEVDSALRTLYCELEASAEARHQVTDLEAQVSHLRRELDLRGSELLLARKAAEMARSSQHEIAQLRLEAAQRQRAADEATALREEKKKLLAELQDNRARLSDMTQTLQEWKQKLSVLIGE
ncbi:hypothetical protein BGZ63DRAFT_389595 [Mariannaea sp. PMI_226]|nr:hypothetical protein BGZ63DRAFT_389595 [Mariannaea sp. PMI_226]